MEFRRAALEDFPEAMKFLRALWDYNTYEEKPTRAVYEEVLQGSHPGLRDPRKDAHQFYKNYGFEKSCYGFEMKI